MSAQLSLFMGSGGDPGGPAAVVTDAQRALAARLPAGLRLGTSSYTYPGWAGLVYAGRPSQARLVEEGLAAYAKHPLLRTVGIDRGYYAPIAREAWQAYANVLPAGSRVVAKAWSEVTTAVFPRHPRYGERAGGLNPRFLDPGLALDEVVRPYAEGAGAHAGPLVLELPPVPDGAIPERALLARLARLFDAIPAGLPIAVELRTPRLLTPAYLGLLRERGVSHVLNFWSGMPTPGEQARLGADEPGARLVFRLLQPPGSSYEALRAAYEPFDCLHAPQPRLREEVAALARRALDRGREVYVCVGNKAEGSAPHTVFALAAMLAEGAA